MANKEELQVRSRSKRHDIQSSLSSSTGSILYLGMDRDGSGISNHLIIQNYTGRCIRLHQSYIHMGKVRVSPDPMIPSRHEDDCLFHANGGWSSSGSGGIVTYKLDYETYLHILWSCPYAFVFSDNFIGLFLSGEDKSTPDENLFRALYRANVPRVVPKRRSPYDLVCCGPGKRNPSANFGYRRPCEVILRNFYVTMTMGDNHKTSSSVSINERPPVRLLDAGQEKDLPDSVIGHDYIDLFKLAYTSSK